jgi:oligopeptide/dipeptide ABC transporter ATP-binding protein
MKLLTVNNLRTYIYSLRGLVKAVDGVFFDIEKGETLGVMGETGCGKSVTALSIMRLLPRRARVVGGEVLFNGEDLLKRNEQEMRHIRGREIAMIFQDPNTSLNPVLRVGDQVAEALQIHESISDEEAKERVTETFRLVGIPDPSRRFSNYPHELSGGMKQRVMIAMALVHNPKLLIADEPTTALDTTIQAQILDLMKELKQKSNSSILLITHDVGVIAEMCNKVAVMYAGELVEYGDVVSIFKEPKHPYTSGLLQTFPRREKELVTIPGFVPDPIDPPHGCKFHPRCKYMKDVCQKVKPKLKEVVKGHKVACHLFI